MHDLDMEGNIDIYRTRVDRLKRPVLLMKIIVFKTSALLLSFDETQHQDWIVSFGLSLDQELGGLKLSFKTNVNPDIGRSIFECRNPHSCN